MTFINTDGMAFIGPGSEWFWTGVSWIVLAVTFITIWRQQPRSGSECQGAARVRGSGVDL